MEIDGGVAKVDFAGNVVRVRVGVVDTRPGDYVLVHAGCAIESMPEEKAMEIIEIFRGMEV
jgi:hydrogenase expression/formation protein HypC